MAQTILVTGAAGFIGSHVSRQLLEEGHDVIGLDNFDPYYDKAIKDQALEELTDHETFTFVPGDIRDPDMLDKLLTDVNVVIHLAARAGVRPSIADPELYNSINVGGTTTLLEACRRAQVRRFVFGSSSSVYGDDTPAPFREEAPCMSPISPYAATKRACELQCRVYSHLHGLRIASLRFFTVYGPRQRPDLAIHRFTRMMAEGKPIPQYGDGSSERDYTWIDDIVHGVKGAMRWTEDAEPKHDVFNLGKSRTIRLDRLIQLIGNALGVDPVIERLPRVAGDVQRTCADITKSHDTFGYNPQTMVEDGIPQFVQWYEESMRHSSL